MHRKNILKHKSGRFLALFLCTALLCTACGADRENTTDTNREEITETDAPQASDSGTSTDPKADETPGESSTGHDGTPDSSAPTNDTSVSSEKSNLRIEMHKEENNKTTENGTVYFYKSCEYPIVSMDGNMEAAEKINADIRARVDFANADTQVEDWADEMIASVTENDADYAPLAYSESLTFKTIRADSSIISFTITYGSFSGGAHDNYITHGVNYNAKTGELLSFSDLSDDPSAFREDTLAYNQKLAETDAYSIRMFSSDDITNGTLESVLYADDAWYLSPSGLIFISNPYALGPYVAGTIEFIIPYSDLSDMGFKESYAYSGRFVLKLQYGETYPGQDNSSAPNTDYTYAYDLNGDGLEDSISLYREYIANEDDIYETHPHLVINDVDFIEKDETIREPLTTFISTWAEPVLYDLDADDDYVELMFVSGELEGGDYIYYSHFYRYTKEGTLEYAGKVKGDANDPSVDTSVLVES